VNINLSYIRLYFSTDEYFAAADVLKWNNETNAYDIYEIKMSSTDDEDEEETEDGKPKKVNRKKEEQYEYDLAFQTNVAKLCGVTFNKNISCVSIEVMSVWANST